MLAAWCVSQHKLENIAQSLRLPLVIAYAIPTTGNYRIDDSVLTGRTGKALDPVRTNAFFQLSMMGKSNDIPLLASLTERVLYGTGPLPLDLSFSPGAPTAEELTANYDLAAAKALSAGLANANLRKRTGRAIVIDYYNYAKSVLLADHIRRAGLSVKTLFSGLQATPYQCGHNTAGWACMLRALGQDFQALTNDIAGSINVPAYPQAQNVRIGKAVGDTSWLTGDEIIKLVSLDNPDANGQNPKWLRGPAPLNYFYTFFAQTMAEPQFAGTVQIMVVNAAVDSGLPQANIGGTHWFTVAWCIDRDEDEHAPA